MSHAVDIWARIREEAAKNAAGEPMLASFLHSVILNHRRLDDALSFILASKLESSTLTAVSLRDLIDEALVSDSSIIAAVRADLTAVATRDPACVLQRL